MKWREFEKGMYDELREELSDEALEISPEEFHVLLVKLASAATGYCYFNGPVEPDGVTNFFVKEEAQENNETC